MSFPIIEVPLLVDSAANRTSYHAYLPNQLDEDDRVSFDEGARVALNVELTC